MLAISHSNVYYLPRATCVADLALMRRIDELHLNYPFGGSRMLRDMLKLEGHQVGLAAPAKAGDGNKPKARYGRAAGAAPLPNRLSG